MGSPHSTLTRCDPLLRASFGRGRSTKKRNCHIDERKVPITKLPSEADSASDGYTEGEFCLNSGRQSSNEHPEKSDHVELNLQSSSTTPVQKVKAIAPIQNTAAGPVKRTEVCQSVESVQSVQGCDQYRITATAAGGTFYSDILLLSGTIPEGTVSEDATLLFCKTDPVRRNLDRFTSYISPIYHVLPHAKTFNKQIVLRFPHTSRKYRFENTMPCYRIRRKVFYSATGFEADPQWEEIGVDGDASISRPDIQAIITQDEVCLMLLRFCCFVAIEQRIPTLFIRAEIYGHKSSDEIYTLVVVLASCTNQKHTQYGECLDTIDLCLVQDIPNIKIRAMDMPRSGWTLAEGYNTEKDLHTHYLWNRQRQTAKFLLTRDANRDSAPQQLCMKFEIEHDTQTTDILLVEHTEQIIRDRTSTNASLSPNSVDRGPDPFANYDSIRCNTVACSLQANNVAYDSRAIAKPLTEHTYHEVKHDSLMLPPPIPMSARPLALRAQSGVTAHENTKQISNHFHFYNPMGVDGNELVKLHQLSKPKLSHTKKIELARLLDPERPDGNDWRMLADQMDYGAYEGMLGKDRSGPTRRLLDMWESQDGPKGSKDHLIIMLKAFKRSDAAAVVGSE